MNEDLKKIIENSTFEIIPGRFVYVKVLREPEIGKHFFISKDKDEITVVTSEDNLSDLEVIEKNKDFYSLISLNVSVPFYSVGFLATVSSAIAKDGMNILIISTYSKDYIMVRYDLLDKARGVLLNLGFKEK